MAPDFPEAPVPSSGAPAAPSEADGAARSAPDVAASGSVDAPATAPDAPQGARDEGVATPTGGAGAPGVDAAQAASSASASSAAEAGGEAAATPSAGSATRASDAAAAGPVTKAQEPASRGASEPADAGPRLRALFPKLFGNPPKPLKLRIQQDIQQQAPGQFSKQALTAFLRRYTGGHGYLVALANGKTRFGLDGEPAGEVTAEHRQAAIDELGRRRANRQARIELDEQQRRNRATLLRDFETTTLTPANFCALKGIAPEELDGLLQRARQEAAQRAQAVRTEPGARRMPSPGERRRRPPRRQETRWT
ncbi:ProQ/FINO family protein [Piscinibacter koreensis]|uniref:ProQ/FinO domain-containing protein n=1 Tax=Piscinibacter koreensis TaxID=2742824 RepID=A0A7Y6TVA8_9BURK|nr:ProQ/FinO family protein [Schlegelella koreensis]NUZ04803.1 hypothetical protein [Schlegelella koreensis]